MTSNINPSLTPVNSLDNFRFWCQKVLPLVYDDSLSYYEVLGKMVVQLNDVIDNVNADTENVLTLKDAFLELQTYVNDFFDDIDQLASYAERAEAAQTAANTSAVNAASSASNASASSLAAMDARDTAVAARQAAQASANTASTAATNANTKASEAAQSAITAQTAQASASQSATLAATDRNAAQTAASTATTKASEASTSASNAQTSAENAAQSKADAEDLVNNIQENLDNIQQNTNDISDLKESIENIEGVFDNAEINLALGEYVTGKYIGNDGTEADNASMSYTSVPITNDLVGLTIFIDGSAWWQIQPFVFVGSDSSIVRSHVPSPGGTYTQYEGLEFKPSVPGTLYINRYASGSSIQRARAYYYEIASLKTSYLPSNIGESLKDATLYKPVSLGNLIESKLVSAVTGAITDGSIPSQRITDFIPVNPDSYYLITTEMHYGYGLYVWYDEDKNFISGKKAANGSTVTQIYCERTKSPSNAAYIVIGFLYQPNFSFPFLMEGEMKSIYPSQRWYGLKWTCIGDSLTESYQVTGAHYFDLICAATGISFVNKGISGSGYANGTNNFMTRALTVDSDSNVVTFFGSGNDASSGLPLGTASDTGTETIAGCINTAIDNLYSVMPVVQLGIVTPTPWQGNMPSDNGWMELYANLIVEICKRRSIPCLDLYHSSNLNPNSANVRAIAYARDGGIGTHPNEVGHAIIAPRFLAFLESLLMH